MAKGKKPAQKKKAKQGANKNSGDTKDKEASTEKDKNDPCELFTFIHHPSSLGSCGCGASMDYAVSSIPQSADWPVSFLLHCASE